MKLTLLICIMVSLTFNNAQAQQCDLLELHCPYGSVGGTVTNEVRISVCGNPIDAIGVTILFDEQDLEYAGVSFSGTLLEGWASVNANLEAPGKLVIVGWDITGFDTATQEPMAKINFNVVSSDYGYSEITFDSNGLYDDVEGFLTINCSAPLPVKNMSWGKLKMLYR